jgi:anti-sigma factor RsiW
LNINPTEHLSSATLNALADGELSGDQLAGVNEHLSGCPQCTSSALFQSLLKSATARAGQRHAPPPDLRERLTRLAAKETALSQAGPSGRKLRPARSFSAYDWAAAAALLLVCVSLFFIAHNIQRNSGANAEYAGLVTEVSDQHIATLAANSPPEVISSDRHTVKPWFQGKIPFSFNLPQNLPAETTLDGANLTYLRNQPTAQLLFSVGKHRVSVFVQQRTSAGGSNSLPAEHAGFHVLGFRTADLQVVAISDVDPTALSNLVSAFEQAQSAGPK